jgi:hypothetical protein
LKTRTVITEKSHDLSVFKRRLAISGAKVLFTGKRHIVVYFYSNLELCVASLCVSSLYEYESARRLFGNMMERNGVSARFTGVGIGIGDCVIYEPLVTPVVGCQGTPLFDECQADVIALHSEACASLMSVVSSLGRKSAENTSVGAEGRLDFNAWSDLVSEAHSELWSRKERITGLIKSLRLNKFVKSAMFPSGY